MYANHVNQFMQKASNGTDYPSSHHNKVLRSKAIDRDLTLQNGDGLFMAVKTTVKKLWRFRYQRPATKQHTMMGLGAFPALSLADARRLRADYLSLVANGIGPQTQAEQLTEQQQIALDSIFSTVAANWFALKQASVTLDYAKDIRRSLEKDVFPAIGDIPVQEIKARAAVIGYSLIILPDQEKWSGDGAGIKAITGGDSVAIDPKYRDAYSTHIPAVILAVNNNPMRFSDRSGGVSRRRVILSFPDVIPANERDPQLLEKIAGDSLLVYLRENGPEPLQPTSNNIKSLKGLWLVYIYSAVERSVNTTIEAALEVISSHENRS